MFVLGEMCADIQLAALELAGHVIFSVWIE